MSSDCRPTFSGDLLQTYEKRNFRRVPSENSGRNNTPVSCSFEE